MTSMKYLILFIGITVIAFIIYACKTKKGMLANQPIEPIIRLSKGRCFGKCKIYRLDIYADKSAKYTGHKNVDRIGDYKGVISVDDYNTIMSLFKTEQFINLEKEYLSGARDLQRISITHDTHTVNFHLRKAPENLKSILQQLDDIIEEISWSPNN